MCEQRCEPAGRLKPALTLRRRYVPDSGRSTARENLMK